MWIPLATEKGIRQINSMAARVWLGGERGAGKSGQVEKERTNQWGGGGGGRGRSGRKEVCVGDERESEEWEGKRG